jgi:hypothetical protein
MQGLKLEPTSFVSDKILDTFVSTSNITDKIDAFFRKIPVYYEMGFEVAKRAALLYGPAGCHAKGTKILMWNGRISNVEDIVVGDQLMGPDSSPRKVLSLARGREKMIKVKPTKGDEFTVNYNHIFHLTPSDSNETIKCPINIKGKDLIQNVTIPFRERFKLTRTGIEFSKRYNPINEYILGSWLGDGHSESTRITIMDQEIVNAWQIYGEQYNLQLKIVSQKGKASTYSLSTGNNNGQVKEGRNVFLSHLQELELINNKHIPYIYLTSDREQRLELLAGLIDTDGSLSNGGYEYVTKLDRLSDDILYLARSLGFAAYSKKTFKKCQTGNGGFYNRIFISGNVCEIPVKIPRKKTFERKQIKDVLRTGFELELLPDDNYYGFSLDKDHLYLTADFTIHHNTGKSTAITKVANKYTADGKTSVIIWHTDKFEAYQVKDFIKSFEYVGVEKIILIAEDIGGIEVEAAKMKSDSSLLSLLDNQEKTFKIPTFILATTNYPANFMGNLTNRPNRFDDKIEVGYPTSEQRSALLQFFGKEMATENALKSIATNKAKEFSPAHIREVVIRAKIYDKTLDEVIIEMIQEIENYKNLFEKSTRMGFD